MLELAIPTVLAQTVNLLYNMVDRVFVGRIPGEGSIVENGFGAIDVLNSDHTCDGSYRIDYLKAHIEFAAYSGV